MAGLLDHLAVTVRVGDLDVARRIWHDTLLRPLLEAFLPERRGMHRHASEMLSRL